MGKNRMVFCALAGALALTLAGCRETAPVPPLRQPCAHGLSRPGGDGARGGVLLR